MHQSMYRILCTSFASPAFIMYSNAYRGNANTYNTKYIYKKVATHYRVVINVRIFLSSEEQTISLLILKLFQDVKGYCPKRSVRF